MIDKIWPQDRRHTVKSCAGVVLIGATVAGGLLIIRLVGERRFQRFLNMLLFKRKEEDAELTTEACLH